MATASEQAKAAMSSLVPATLARPMSVAQLQGNPFAKAPSVSLSPGQQKAMLQAAVESLPGASEYIGVRDGHEAGMQIGPALREGRYGDAAMAAINSIAAPVASLIGVHMTPAFAGVMRAYHGSPHVFDEFKWNAETRGTGEGAQAYGDGLYFAENEGVAKSYRQAGQPAYKNPAVQKLAQSAHDGASAAGFSGDEAVKEAGLRLHAQYLKTTDPHLKQQLADAGNNLSELLKGSGALYDVHLDVEPHELLHWDKPLSEQSPQVREKLAATGLKVTQKPYTVEATKGGGQFVVYHPGGWELGRFRSEEKARAEATRLTNEDTPLDARGEQIYRDHLGGSRDPAAASAALRDAGIPGLRYLDAGSRSAADGTHNIVMFDDSRISIRARNGQPLPSSADQAKAAMAGLVPTTTLGRP